MCFAWRIIFAVELIFFATGATHFVQAAPEWKPQFNVRLNESGSYVLKANINYPNATLPEALQKYMPTAHENMPKVSRTVTRVNFRNHLQKSTPQLDFLPAADQDFTLLSQSTKYFQTDILEQVCSLKWKDQKGFVLSCILDTSKGAGQYVSWATTVWLCVQASNGASVYCELETQGQAKDFEHWGVVLRSARSVALGGLAEILYDVYGLSYWSAFSGFNQKNYENHSHVQSSVLKMWSEFDEDESKEYDEY